MKLLSLLGTAAALIAFAAGPYCRPAHASAAARLDLQSSGILRSALVVERGRLKLRKRPLLIILHPPGSSGARHHRVLALEAIAPSSKPVFVYPDALGGEWPAAAGPDADRDVKFVRDLVDQFIGDGFVDPQKIFIIGESSGGAIAYRAVCAGIGQTVAGLVTVNAAMPADLSNCTAKPLPFIAINDIGDSRAPYVGGAGRSDHMQFDALSTESTLALFAKNSGCLAKREDTLPAERDARGESPAGMSTSYSGCKAPVELVRLGPAGASVDRKPDHSTMHGDEGRDVGIGRIIWQFLKRNGA